MKGKDSCTKHSAGHMASSPLTLLMRLFMLCPFCISVRKIRQLRNYLYPQQLKERPTVTSGPVNAGDTDMTRRD